MTPKTIGNYVPIISLYNKLSYPLLKAAPEMSDFPIGQSVLCLKKKDKTDFISIKKTGN